MTARKGISERAVDGLETHGHLMTVRAEMKAEAIKSLVDLEEAGKIPPSLRINRYTFVCISSLHQSRLSGCRVSEDIRSTDSRSRALITLSVFNKTAIQNSICQT
jgi:hypothetical protein